MGRVNGRREFARNHCSIGVGGHAWCQLTGVQRLICSVISHCVSTWACRVLCAAACHIGQCYVCSGLSYCVSVSYRAVLCMQRNITFCQHMGMPCLMCRVISYRAVLCMQWLIICMQWLVVSAHGIAVSYIHMDMQCRIYIWTCSALSAVSYMQWHLT